MKLCDLERLGELKHRVIGTQPFTLLFPLFYYLFIFEDDTHTVRYHLCCVIAEALDPSGKELRLL
jgi:hypothetical protein